MSGSTTIAPIRRIDLRTGIITTVSTRPSLTAISALALDPSGDLIVAQSSQIRRVSVQDGSVRDIAGSGGNGFTGDGGPAVRAELCIPTGVAVDRAGDVYIADSCNHRIRRVDASTGVISTVAGSGRPGWSGDGGPATGADLEFPDSVAVDADGDVFILQRGHQPYGGCIRRVDARTGTIQTIAGRGSLRLGKAGRAGRKVRLESPHDVLLNGEGNLLFVEADRVYRLQLRTGMLSAVPGTRPGQVEPSSIAMAPDGSLLMADFQNNRVWRLDLRTSALTLIGGNGLPHQTLIEL